MSESLDIAISNLTSVSVLVFALGFLAARFNSDIRIPDQVYQIISVYLLFGIGLKGGVSLYHSGANGLLRPITATIVLGIFIPLIAFLILKRFKRLSEVDQGALAAHYGSTSLVTFTAALVYLDNVGVQYEGFVTALSDNHGDSWDCCRNLFSLTSLESFYFLEGIVAGDLAWQNRIPSCWRAFCWSNSRRCWV